MEWGLMGDKAGTGKRRELDPECRSLGVGEFWIGRSEGM